MPGTIPVTADTGITSTKYPCASRRDTTLPPRSAENDQDEHTSPWNAILDSVGDLESLVRRATRMADFRPGHGGRDWSPVSEHGETADAYLVRVELPGIPRDQVHVQLHGRELSVSGEISAVEVGGHMLSRRAGRFAHHTTLPTAAAPEHVRAAMADGVLVVRIPKGGAADGPRTVPVEAPM